MGNFFQKTLKQFQFSVILIHDKTWFT
jgi:hypothetical protein